MATVNTDQAREVFEAAGLSGSALEQAMSGLANMRTTAGIEVVVNPEAERKFGDVTIYKVQGNGYRQPKLALRIAQIPELIAGLTAAQAAAGEEEGS